MPKSKKPRKKKPRDPNPDLFDWLVPKLRKLSMQWPPAYEAVKRARKAPNSHECAHCLKRFKDDAIKRDHIQPVVDPRKEGRGMTWDEYLGALFCQTENYQILCKPCHDKKTDLENIDRQNRPR
jgi:5-methylcytosine-specific restriction endonuclease McrA